MVTNDEENNYNEANLISNIGNNGRTLTRRQPFSTVTDTTAPSSSSSIYHPNMKMNKDNRTATSNNGSNSNGPYIILDKKKYDDYEDQPYVPKIISSSSCVADATIPLSSPSSSSSSSIGQQKPHVKAISNQDKMSMLLLLVLYTLQGIPMGLCGSIPLLLKERKVSYEGLSLFSLVSLPFSLKIVWAPIVDTFYLPSVGRRKTWLIPVQLLCGIVMILGSSHVSRWIGDNNVNVTSQQSVDNNNEINVTYLVAYFLFLYFLMATQDIAVDGWALTMLTRENVGYASLCNSIGQSLGVFLSNQGFIALSDPLFCRQFLGLLNNQVALNLKTFMLFWGIVFIIITCIIWLGKKEINNSGLNLSRNSKSNLNLNSSGNDSNNSGGTEYVSSKIKISRSNNSIYNSRSNNDKLYDNTNENNIDDNDNIDRTTINTAWRDTSGKVTYKNNNNNSSDKFRSSTQSDPTNSHTPSSSSSLLYTSSNSNSPNSNNSKATKTALDDTAVEIAMRKHLRHHNSFDGSFSINEKNVVISEGGNEEDGFTFYETIMQLYSIFKIPLIHLLIVILLTCKVPFAPADSVSNFKFQEYGMPKTELSLIAPLLMILGFLTPMFLGKYISNYPLKTLVTGLKLKLFTSFLRWFMVQLCQVIYALPIDDSNNSIRSIVNTDSILHRMRDGYDIDTSGDVNILNIPNTAADMNTGSLSTNNNFNPLMYRYLFFYALIITFALHEVAGTLIFVSFMTFFTKISDPLIGGTYMTLLNTVTNLGSIWPSALALWLLPKLNFAIGGWSIDGYTVESFFCLCAGGLWLYVFQKRLLRLRHANHKDWSVTSGKESETELSS